VIVVVEGPSAAGKTSWIARHCDSEVVVNETTPEIANAAPNPQQEPVAAAAFWAEQNRARWEEALRVERTHGVAICDSDPFKLHYPWSLWRSGHASLNYWEASFAATRRLFRQGELGLADLTLVSIPNAETLIRQRRGDRSRRRRNFDLHIELAGPLVEWYKAVEQIDPSRVKWQLPSNGLPGTITVRASRSGDNLFEALLSHLPST
jgi:hypothetical protein